MHAGEFSKDFGVPEAQDTVTFSIDEGRASLVVLRLGVLTAVKLNDQQAVATCKIDDVRADRVLPDKLQPVDASIAHQIPEPLLGQGCRSS
jgi:hypothetical protein